MALSKRDILVVPIPGQLVDTTVTKSTAEGQVFSTPAPHGLTVGQLVRVDASSSTTLSLADKGSDKAAQFMVSEVVDNKNVRLAKSGDAVTLSGFANGDLLFLGDNGNATKTSPQTAGQLNQFIGQYHSGQAHLNFTIAIKNN